MSGLSPEAAALLARTRGLDAPPTGAKERVRAALDTALENGPPPATPRIARVAPRLVVVSILVLSAMGVILVGMNTLKTEPGTEQAKALTMKPISFPRPSASPDWPSVMRSRRDLSPAMPAQALKRGNPDSTLQAELALLRAAQEARSAGNPRDAETILSTHRKRFPDGILRAEREAASVLVECDLGHRARAEKAARAFVQRYPDSPLVRTVNRSCAGQRVEGGTP